MAKLPIIIAPDPRLKITAEPVDEVDDGIRKLMDDLLDTMYAAPGIGLSAPQVGVAKRVLVIDLAREGSPPTPLRVVNPELVWTSNELKSNEEGCLSLPGQFAEIKRPESASVRYIDSDNVTRKIEVSGALSACLQHEMDHLDGRLFVDHLSRLKRDMILRKLSKMRRADGNAIQSPIQIP
ncbi:MAG TPA: peptide deformylase [Alphaproteobacteria bacterium]|nr:peptide deformylase [Alphaproteobacteria bacterium]